MSSRDIVFAFSLVCAAVSQAPIVGRIPQGLDDATRVVWIGIDETSGDVRCGLSTPTRWSCYGVSLDTRGLVVIVGDRGVSAVAIGLPALDSMPTTWGRVVHITPGGVAPEDLHDLTLTAYKPERSRLRKQTKRFAQAKDEDVHVVKVSETTFWVSGLPADPDAFVAFEGPAVGNQRVSTQRLSEGAPEDPVFLPALAGAAIIGRVRGAHGEDADAAEVELWELLRSGEPTERFDDNTPAVRRRAIYAARDGTFQFDRIAGSPILLSAFHTSLGAARRWITEFGPPVDLELTPAPKVTGRVLKRGLPAASALIRFTPDPGAFAASADPRDYLGQEGRTADDGRFSLALPPKHAGAIQITLDDGSSARVAIPDVQIKSELVLGDISVPDGRHLTVRVLDANECVLVALGPVGVLGLTMVRAASPTSVYELELPEAGTWSLIAECGRTTYGVDPPIVVVPADRAAPAVDARVIKTPG